MSSVTQTLPRAPYEREILNRGIIGRIFGPMKEILIKLARGEAIATAETFRFFQHQLESFNSSKAATAGGAGVVAARPIHTTIESRPAAYEAAARPLVTAPVSVPSFLSAAGGAGGGAALYATAVPGAGGAAITAPRPPFTMEDFTLTLRYPRGGAALHTTATPGAVDAARVSRDAAFAAIAAASPPPVPPSFYAVPGLLSAAGGAGGGAALYATAVPGAGTITLTPTAAPSPSAPLAELPIAQRPAIKATNADIASFSDELVGLKVQVSGNKVRLTLEMPKPKISDPSRDQLLNYFMRTFNGKANEIPASGGYAALGFARCWSVAETETRVDFWFPSDHRLTNTEVNKLIADLLGPLRLSDGKIPDGAKFGSIATLEPRVYVTAVEKMTMPLKNAVACCQAFLGSTEAVAREKGVSLNDAVLTAAMPVTAAVDGGVMFFGAPPAAAAPAAASLVSSAAPTARTAASLYPSVPPSAAVLASSLYATAAPRR